jgi:two-component system, NtrC family, nitrogen regulation sensor histidine kinase NtrY
MAFSVAQVAWKAVRLTALLTFFAAVTIKLLLETHFFATALLSALACCGVAWSLYVLINHADETFISQPPVGEAVVKNDYLQALLDTVSSVLIVLDGDGRITLANRAAHRFVGMPVVKLAQISAFSGTTADQIDALPPGSSEILKLADGQPALVTVARFGSPISSSQRLISLQRIIGNLDAVELKAWHDMMRVLTHEMMNSLTPITSLTESLVDWFSSPITHATATATSHDPSHLVETISRRARGLMEFVERYRQIAELPRPLTQEIDAEKFLLRLESLHAAKNHGMGVSFRFDVDPPGSSFRADPVLLEQALLNLIGNAFESFGSETAGSIYISCRVSDAAIRLEVIDNGCGVEESAREHLFVPFFTTKSNGTGIGLNLARNIAMSHLGTVTYEPNAPKGSVFRITLPRLAQMAAPALSHRADDPGQ